MFGRPTSVNRGVDEVRRERKQGRSTCDTDVDPSLTEDEYK